MSCLVKHSSTEDGDDMTKMVMIWQVWHDNQTWVQKLDHICTKDLVTYDVMDPLLDADDRLLEVKEEMEGVSSCFKIVSDILQGKGESHKRI